LISALKSLILKLVILFSNNKEVKTRRPSLGTQPFYGPFGSCLGPPGWAGTRKVKPIWIYWSKR